MLKTGLYKGFSSFEFEKTKSFSLNDFELVKMDLLNHIFTLRGTRVMMPTYGTQIPQLVFEPLDTEVLTIIEDELRDVFEADPRVELFTLDMQSSPDNHSIIANAQLYYVELQITDNFELNITFEA